MMTIATAAAFVLLLPALAQAQRAGIVVRMQGAATVLRQAQAPPAPQPLGPKDTILIGDRITTGEASLVSILLGGVAVLTMQESSQLRILEPRGLPRSI
jgi:hypothetical protein